ncbi:class I SAM-dependent methyltransferase [Rhizobium mesoamericanum]|uniref:class I SAM-dependent methyltransferase n=1 Tax=Rhizobium mesoamericanum TaxID=1079800 RepID=UPI000688794C|nr:rRNA adenine N-6-methyltransferase family protein [Rhizobium mesoamericanum]
MKNQTHSDTSAFLRAWLDAPLQTGAQLPSSRHLARAMAAAIDPAIPGAVLELGPGTGVVTEALVERGIDPARLVLVEANPDFCSLLKTRYPSATVLLEDAYAAPRLLRNSGARQVSAVVSSLPLMTRRPSRRHRLLLDSLRLIIPGAPFVQFTYFFRSPIPLPQDRLTVQSSPIVWRNLWPARVWCYRMPNGQQFTVPPSWRFHE